MPPGGGRGARKKKRTQTDAPQEIVRVRLLTYGRQLSSVRIVSITYDRQCRYKTIAQYNTS